MSYHKRHILYCRVGKREPLIMSYHKRHTLYCRVGKREPQAHYYRKLRTDLQGGPPLNARDDKNEMKSRRAKMSGTQNWFNRKRGGAPATERKDQNWRLDKDRKDHRREDGRLRQRRQGPRRDEGKEEKDPTGDKSKRGTISTLLVPFTVGGTLQRMVQSAEDSYVDLIGGD